MLQQSRQHGAVSEAARRCAPFAAVLALVLAYATFFSAAASAASPSASPQVRFIVFHGTRHFSAKQLKEVLETKEKRFRWLSEAPLNDERFAEDLGRLEQYYKSQGFYHMRVASHQVSPLLGREVRVDIHVEEGPPMVLKSVEVRVNQRLESPWDADIRKLLPLQPGKRFTSPGYRDCEKALLRYLSDWGYPKAKVELGARLDKRSNEAKLSVDVTTGPVCTFGPVAIEGLHKVEEQIIWRELTFRPGERFSMGRIQESQRRLFNLTLFQFVDMTVEEMDSDAVELPVRILVKEARKQTVRAGIGYGTEDKYRGRLEWEIRDFLGDGRRLEFDAKASAIVQIVEGTFYQPYLLDAHSAFQSKTGISQENQVAYDNRKVYTYNSFEYLFSPKITARLGHQLESNRLLDVNLDLLAREKADESNQEFFISSLVMSLAWVRVDDILNPKTGFQVLPNLEWASSALGSEVDYVRMSLEGRGYVPVGDIGVVAARLLWGSLSTAENTDSIPIFKRFFAGGSNSVRGYPYQRLGPLDRDGDPIGGLTLFEGSVEARVPVYEKLEGVVFFDFGNVYLDSFASFDGGLRYTSGCGIRYLTPVGPVRFDFGYALNPIPGDFFAPYHFYFSIGQAF
jgi:outer membrane protein insertion porin family/translocation and assembly module TamA